MIFLITRTGISETYLFLYIFYIYILGQITTLKVGSLLDDNLWHDVSIHRNQSDITFSVDRVLIQQVRFI